MSNKAGRDTSPVSLFISANVSDSISTPCVCVEPRLAVSKIVAPFDRARVARPKHHERPLKFYLAAGVSRGKPDVGYAK